MNKIIAFHNHLIAKIEKNKGLVLLCRGIVSLSLLLLAVILLLVAISYLMPPLSPEEIKRLGLDKPIDLSHEEVEPLAFLNVIPVIGLLLLSGYASLVIALIGTNSLFGGKK